jgi:hypothetical protein
MPKYCSQCGVEFRVKCGTQVTCLAPECRRAHEAAAQKRWYERNIESIREKTKAYMRARYRSDPAFRARATQSAVAAAKKRYNADPEYRKRWLAYSAEWRRRKYAMDPAWRAKEIARNARLRAAKKATVIPSLADPS